MISGSEVSEVRRFLETFFGDQNELKLREIDSEGGSGADIRPWVDRLAGDVPLSSVVPHKFLDAAGKHNYHWYGLARSGRELRDLSENVMAFVGPTWSTFRGERASLNTDDLIESAVSEYTNGFALKFKGDNKKIWQRLELMRHVVWGGHNPRPVEDVRPAGRVLRDFNIALQVLHRENAENALTILQHKHGYDAINISFLRVQMLAAFGKWGELLEASNISEMMLVRRPTAVTQTLIGAVYKEELMGFEETGDGRGALRRFRNEVLPKHGSLFSIRAGMRSPEAVTCFTLLALSSEPVDHAFLDEVPDWSVFEPGNRKFLEQLLDLVPERVITKFTDRPKPSEDDPLHLALQKLWEGDYDNSFRTALNSPRSVQRVQLLLQCAYELQTLESERSAINEYEQLSRAEKDSLLGTRSSRVLVENIVGKNPSASGAIPPSVPEVIEVVPCDWTEWLQRLYAEPNWGRANDVARLGSTEWKVESFLAEKSNIDEMVTTLAAYPVGVEATLHECLPYLLDFFRKDSAFPRRECGEIYNLLLYLLTVSTNGGEDDLALFNDIVVALLSLGMKQNEYDEVLSNAEELWKNYSSPANVDWSLDLIDHLIFYPCPDEDKRKGLLNLVVNSLTPFARRIEFGQWNFITILINDLQSDELLPVISQYRPQASESSLPMADALTYLNGKVITVYTLTESVARRVKTVIESACKNATVNLSHERVGSERLRQWSRNSDILVMVTGSAKHAATEFIEASRGDLPILRPLGKGSASIFREIYRFIATTLND